MFPRPSPSPPPRPLTWGLCTSGQWSRVPGASRAIFLGRTLPSTGGLACLSVTVVVGGPVAGQEVGQDRALGGQGGPTQVAGRKGLCGGIGESWDSDQEQGDKAPTSGRARGVCGPRRVWGLLPLPRLWGSWGPPAPCPSHQAAPLLPNCRGASGVFPPNAASRPWRRAVTSVPAAHGGSPAAAARG